MDTVLILQIVTIVVSITSVLINSVITLTENRKKNYISSTTKQRISNHMEIRKGIIEILAKVSVSTIEEAKSTKSTTYKSDLMESKYKVYFVFNSIYPEEKTMLELIESLTNNATIYFDTPTKEVADRITGQTQQLIELYEQYHLADWRFIKKQSEGKILNSSEFDIIYSEVVQEFANKGKNENRNQTIE